MSKDNGLSAVPPNDEEMKEWLWSRLHKATGSAESLASEFREVIELGEENEEPAIFAYARLLTHLGEISQPELLEILSAFVWHNAKGNNE